MKIFHLFFFMIFTLSFIYALVILNIPITKLSSSIIFPFQCKSDTVMNLGPPIYVITPTYYRLNQKAELVKQCNTFLHVENLHWILIEDSELETSLVSNFVSHCAINITHLFAPSPPKESTNNIRGSKQRNKGLEWIRNNVSPGTPGVVYFADDDNTYDPEVFKEMGSLREAATWPVGLIAGSTWEGCLVDPNNTQKIASFWTNCKRIRKFPIDMAAFAVNVSRFFRFPDANFDYIHRGLQEGVILERLGFKSAFELEPKANGCSRILVWHTKAVIPKHERILPSQPNITDIL